MVFGALFMFIPWREFHPDSPTPPSVSRFSTFCTGTAACPRKLKFVIIIYATHYHLWGVYYRCSFCSLSQYGRNVTADVSLILCIRVGSTCTSTHDVAHVRGLSSVGCPGKPMESLPETEHAAIESTGRERHVSGCIATKHATDH